MKKVTKWHMLIIGLLFFALAWLLLWMVFSIITSTFDKMILVIAIILLLFVSSIFFIIFVYSHGKPRNVFLYDKKTKKEIEVTDLTFEKVCQFLDVYVGLVLNNIKSFAFSNFENDNFLPSVPKQYRPLILMRLFLIWMESGTNERWKQFAETDKRNVDVIEKILFRCGEYRISSKLQYLRTSYTGDDAYIEDFFLNNIEYFKGFILKYVKDNIRLFD